jgi:subtilisin family serine protease
MMVKRLLSTVLLCACFLLLLLPVSSSTRLTRAESGSVWDEWDVIPGRLLVEYQPQRSQQLEANPSAAGVAGLTLEPIDAPVQQEFELTHAPAEFKSLLPNTFVGTFDPAQRDEVLAALYADPTVVYVGPDRKLIASPDWGTATPNDPLLGQQWGMTRIHAASVWQRQSAARSSVRVAVNEGDRFDWTHPDLSLQVSSVSSSTQPIGDHASHVAGIIGATGDNNRGVAGVANVELVNMDNGANTPAFIQQLTWAVNNGVDVVNMSWHWCGPAGCDHCSYTSPDNQVQQAIYSASADLLMVAAAVNDGCDTDGNGNEPLPAGYVGVLAVSALDTNDTLAWFSNFGAYVDLTAPGVSVTSTISNSQYGDNNGTSMAAPHVAGVAAAMLAIKPAFPPDSLERLLELTAEDIGATGRDDSFGYGVVRADRALAALADKYAESDQTVCAYPGPQGIGTLLYPHCTVSQTVSAAPANGVAGLVRGARFTEALTITKAITLISVGGIATIGR